MLHVTTLPTAQSAGQFDFTGTTAIVIDVLRATSVITTAMANGATSVFAAGSIDEAWAEHRRNNSVSLVCGEKDAVKIEGFHLGNSPLEFSPEKVGGKPLILLTSNGTQAIRASMKADRVLILSFLNLEAVSRVLRRTNDRVVIVCSGTNGNFSLDDALCAGMLINRIAAEDSHLCDLSQALAGFAAAEKRPPVDVLNHCFHLKYLRNKGFADDVTYCLSTDAIDIVPFWNHGLIVSGDLNANYIKP